MPTKFRERVRLANHDTIQTHAAGSAALPRPRAGGCAETRPESAVSGCAKSQAGGIAGVPRPVCAVISKLSGGNGLGATRVQDYRIFLSRLGEAVRQQEALIAQCGAQHEQTRQQWMECRGQSQADRQACRPILPGRKQAAGPQRTKGTGRTRPEALFRSSPQIIKAGTRLAPLPCN